MSESTIAALIIAAIASIPPTIAALSARKIVKQNDVKTDSLIAQTEVIHQLTNSNLSSVKEELAAVKTALSDAKSELADAKKQITELRVLVGALAEKHHNG
jgi:septal ring factor EnvC (AmiA/AmiB activator)